VLKCYTMLPHQLAVQGEQYASEDKVSQNDRNNWTKYSVQLGQYECRRRKSHRERSGKRRTEIRRGRPEQMPDQYRKRDE
jgi:hypothetical protein